MWLLSGGIIISDNETAKRLNELARHKMIVRLLDDIRIDLMICEIEGWNKLEYIRMLQEEIGNIGRQ
jgi:hypothetical protein